MNGVEFQQFDQGILKRVAFNVAAACSSIADVDDALQEINADLLRRDVVPGQKTGYYIWAARMKVRDILNRSSAWRSAGTYANPVQADSYEVMREAGYDMEYDPDFDTDIEIAEIWAQLRPEDRMFLRLHYYEDLTVTEMARLYGVVQSAISQRRDKLLSKIRQMIGIADG